MSVAAADVGKDVSQLAKSILTPHNPKLLSPLLTPHSLSLFSNPKDWKQITSVSGPPPKQIVTRESWNFLNDHLNQETSSENSSVTTSPIVAQLDPSYRKIYGHIPLEEETVVYSCQKCQKPILAQAFKDHLETCGLPIPQPESTQPDSSQESHAMNSPVDALKSSKSKAAMKKRKNSVTSVGGDSVPNTVQDDKKKPKKDNKKATPKVKPPLDLDRQCGVIGPNNQPCARSVTCKSHSMTAKREVQGRSRPFLELFREAQERKEQMRAKLPGAATKPNVKAVAGVKPPPVPEQPVDSDEEVNTILETIRLNRPQPLAIKPRPMTYRRTHCLRVHDMLLDALKPKEILPESHQDYGIS